EELGEPLLQLAVELLRAADEPHRRHAVAPAVERLARRLDDRRMAREAEVVVRAHVEELAPLHVDVRVLRRAHDELRLERARVADFGEAVEQILLQRAVHGYSSLQSSSTLPEFPECATANASS